MMMMMMMVMMTMIILNFEGKQVTMSCCMKLKCSSVGMRRGTDRQTDRHTDGRGQYTFRFDYASREM